jgi:hypothetical protein
MKHFNVYGTNLTKEDISLIKKMMGTLKKDDVPVQYTIIDVATTEEGKEVNKESIIFGMFVKSQIEIIEDIETWTLPDIKKLHNKEDNKDFRKSAQKIFAEIQEYLQRDTVEEAKEEPSKQENFVEYKGYKFGEIGDIIITEKEAEHLNKIKSLLNGSKMVIKKGDITIEVE